jgi:D-glycero-alpha-D-manno-heptose-7-phosphate kinase
MSKAMKIFRAKAPLRISFAGGGTDVSPYADERGGLVLNATVDKYAYATLREAEDQSITIKSLDYHTIAKYDLDQPLVYDGQLDLVKAAIRRLNGEVSSQAQTGFELYLHTDAPPGSGLGSSSAIVVAIIGAFQQWLHLPLTSYEIASLAYQIERVDLGIKGGRQDQYAAAFGGFNLIEFYGDRVVVNPLRVPDDILNELHYSLMLFYTGGTRLSANIIDSQTQGFVQRKASVVEAMDELKRLATETKNALLQGRLEDFGSLLHTAWMNKKKMANTITNPMIDEIYDQARRLGALGGKISGAGGGGYMFLYCPYETQPSITERLESMGAPRVDFSFEKNGLQSWETQLSRRHPISEFPPDPREHSSQQTSYSEGS